MLRPTTKLIIVVIVVTLAACSKSNQNSVGVSSSGSYPAGSVPKTTSESVVKVMVQGAEIFAGGMGDAIVRVNVKSGYHINSNPPTFPYLKATELEITDTNEISLNSVF